MDPTELTERAELHLVSISDRASSPDVLPLPLLITNILSVSIASQGPPHSAPTPHRLHFAPRPVEASLGASHQNP
jgi:hypothetical protein